MFFELLAGENHVTFENAGAKVDVVFGEFLEENIEDVASDFCGLIDGIITIIDDFGLDDGDDIVGLAGFGIFCEDCAVFLNGVVGGS